MSVGVIDLFDVYAYLAKVTGSRDAEMPLLSPINLRLEPGERMTVDLMVKFRFTRQGDGATVEHDNAYRQWPPRPIFTKNGTIIFEFDTSSLLSIHNCTGSDFQIQNGYHHKHLQL